MKKQILATGKILSKTEQKEIVGGARGPEFCLEYSACTTDANCCSWQSCQFFEFGSPHFCLDL